MDGSKQIEGEFAVAPTTMTLSSSLISASKAELEARTLLESGSLPFGDLASLANREGFRPRPIYQMHKWFARRLGTSFRALLAAAQSNDVREFWDIYYGVSPGKIAGKTVLDPFVGGGTSLVEASRFGAHVLGFDVDPVACLVTQFELDAGELPDLEPVLRELQQTVGARMSPLYRLRRAELGELTVVHWFWVQQVHCGQCGTRGSAHPNYLVAETDKHRVVLCPTCGNLHQVRRGAATFTCSCSTKRHRIDEGSVSDGRYQCAACGHVEPLIEIARRDGKPRFRLFAAEVADISTKKRPDRRFVRTTRADEITYRKAKRLLQEDLETQGLWGEQMTIPHHGMGDGRLSAYGYDSWLELFNDRQMLHLRLLERFIRGQPAPVRRALSLAFSAHLPSNCILASYTAKWRRLSPLFSIRGFRHIARPTELNPWLDGVGRGTYPNAVRKLMRAKEFSRRPREPLLDGGFTDVPPVPGGTYKIRCVDSSREGALKPDSVDFILTDPPYFDFIHYAGLASFFAPWLSLLGLTSKQNRKSIALRSLASRRECELSTQRFTDRMGAVFERVEVVMRESATMVFTYRHSAAEGWDSLFQALARTSLEVVQVIPLPGEARSGLHVEDGSSRWDAVLVLKKQRKLRAASGISLCLLRNAEKLAEDWRLRLDGAGKLSFTDADLRNLRRALLVGAALGMGGDRTDSGDVAPMSELSNWLRG